MTFKWNRDAERRLTEQAQRQMDEANRRAQERSSTLEEYKVALADEMHKIGVHVDDAALAGLVDERVRAATCEGSRE